MKALRRHLLNRWAGWGKGFARPARLLLGASRGQSVVELALAVPLLALALIGAFEVARVLLAAVVLQTAVQAGAQYGALSPANASDATGIANAVRAEANLPGAGPSNPTVTSSTTTDANAEGLVTVQATFTVTTLFPYPAIPQTFVVTRGAAMQVRR